MELLRREALADAAAGNDDDAIGPAPAAAPEVALAPMVAPHRADPPLAAVPADMLAGFRTILGSHREAPRGMREAPALGDFRLSDVTQIGETQSN